MGPFTIPALFILVPDPLFHCQQCVPPIPVADWDHMDSLAVSYQAAVNFSRYKYFSYSLFFGKITLARNLVLCACSTAPHIRTALYK